MVSTARPRPAPTGPAPGRSTIPEDSPLTLLGRGADPGSEKGVVCPGDLPSPADPELEARAREARDALGEEVVVLGHHYQRDQVIAFADARGDSFKLARFAADRDAPWIIFCGVHFMAESAAILSGDDQRVLLPDLAAGCSMADMAEMHQLVDAWDRLERAGLGDGVTVPLTYMNSAASLKAFTGEHGGAVCTSSNAPTAMAWGLEQADKLLFLPDQHLGRNAAVLGLGLDLDDCVVYDPWRADGGLTDEELREATVVLWKGHCSVHKRFLPGMVERIRRELPGVEVLAHPECRHEVVVRADRIGSTSQIIGWVEEAPAGATLAIATELNLVRRLGDEHPDKQVVFLDETVCFCATMNRIDLPHLVWVMESLLEGEVVNEVQVSEEVRHWSQIALERMLSLPGDGRSIGDAA